MSMPSRQRGTTSVEFAIIAVCVLVVMFAVLEMGRLLYTFSVLSEGTRRAARLAAVCPINDPKIAAAVNFAGVTGFSNGNVSVAYLDQNGNSIGSPTSTAGFSSIRYVRVQITGYAHQLVIPLVAPSLTVPAFKAILPSESLGVVAGASVAC
jgi:Flp pilus assembly protein TadG